MTSKESLRIFCSECERKMARNKIRCPFRSILNDFCGEYKIIEKDLETLDEFEILKNYYEPFKQFLKDMFEKGHNEDLTKIKEWLNE